MGFQAMGPMNGWQILHSLLNPPSHNFMSWWAHRFVYVQFL